MRSRLILKIRTASGAIAVQIVDQSGRATTSVEHIGSANTDAELALLLQTAKQRVLPGQLAFDFAETWNKNPTASMSFWRSLGISFSLDVVVRVANSQLGRKDPRLCLN